MSFYTLTATTALLAQQTDTITIDSSELKETKPEFNKPSNFVFFQGDTLFAIYANLGPYSAKERALIISERLESFVKKQKKIEIDSFLISEVNNYLIISYNDIAILSVGDADIESLTQTKMQLANEYLESLQNSFGDMIEKQTLFDWLLNIGFTLLSITGLFLIFFLLKKSFVWINTKLVHYEKGLKRKRKSVFKYLVPSHSSNIFLVFSKILKLAITLLILFLYLPFLFSFLPWTEGLAEQFYGYIADPVTKIIKGFINFIPNIFSILVIVLIARYLLRIITYISKEIEDEKLKIKGFHRDWARPTFNLIKIVIYILALVFSAQYLPMSKAFQSISIFVGVLFTLGSTSAIANMVAGIVITYMRPFAIGDRVKIGETVGDVVEKNLLVTRLKTTKNEDVTIPNATIINTHLWNYSKNAHSVGIILHPTVTIGYDVPSEQVIKLLLNAAKNTKNLTREFKPFVLQKGLNDFYVEYELNVYTKQPKKMPHFYSELYKSILHEFNNAGVEILSPHYSAFRDGNASTISEEPKPATKPVEKIIDKVTGKK